MSPRVTRAQQLRADVSEVAHESFEAALIVKSLGREDHEAERFRVVTHELRDANIEVGRTRGRFDPAIEAIPTIGTLAVLFVGTLRVEQRASSRPAEVVQIAYLFSILAFPVRALGWVLAELPRAVVGWNRVSAVLDATGSMTFGDRARCPSGTASHLQAERLAYAYEIETETRRGRPQPGRRRRHPRRRPPAATVAIVGPTGQRQVDADQPRHAPRRPRLRRGARRRRRPARGAPRRRQRVAALVAQQTFMFDDTRPRQHHPRRRARRRERLARPARRAGRRLRRDSCPPASTPGSASAAPASPGVSASESPWPAR